MNGDQGLFGQMMRHGGAYGYHSNMHDAGTSSVEWAILGIVIAILILVLLLFADRCRHRHEHRRHGWDQHGAAADEPLTIVRMRYSRGEMTREEYLLSLGDLGAPLGGNEPPESTEPAKRPRRRRDPS